MNPKEGTALLINQIIETLKQLDDEQYSQKLTIFGGATLGQHFRHIFDFYHCLQSGILNGTVNYSKRKRNPQIENHTAEAIRQFSATKQLVTHMSLFDQLAVIPDFSPQLGNHSLSFSSSVGRELMYAYDHAIHHLAIIKIGVKSQFPGLEIDPDLGIAPSTIRYRNEQGY